MKQNNIQALAVTVQALTITSQLLAIGIEVGIIAGGYFVYKKITEETKEPVSVVPENCGIVFVPTERELKKMPLKQKWDKTRKIIKAVLG